MYEEDDLLMLSGIQHFAFCQRQWALIHIEQQWQENSLTLQGDWLHRNVDNPYAMERNKDTVLLRSVAVVSYRLGLYGIADLIEFTPSTTKDNAMVLPKYNGFWLPYPIEYKHGRPKEDETDEVQLCAQAMCLEEMYNISVSQGAFYYGQTKHRLEVTFTDALRHKVEEYASQMHQQFKSGMTPKAAYESKCRSCSINNQCFPMRRAGTTRQYLNQLQQQ